MRTASYRVSDLQKFTIPLGFVGENEHCQIVFLAEDVYQEYPHAAASLTVRPPYGEPYPAVVTRDGTNVVWTVKDSDLVKSGQGELQLSFTTGEIVAKTYVGKTKVCRSLQPTGDVPDPLEDFLTEAGAALTAIPETIDAALEAAKESGEFDGPQGPAGQDGQPGADGYSPTITVTDITGGNRLTITDKTGTRTVDVMDGEDGQPGQDGQDGAPGTDGFSPVITVTDITGGHRLTITTATGTQTVDVMDGSGGDPTEIIDDTAGAGDTDKVWSADKTSELKSAINVLEPQASSSDVGKFLKAKTVADGKVSEYEFGEASGGGVSDVQVNGTSVVSQGVANVPVAGANIVGAVAVNSGYGVAVGGSNNLYITEASSANIKSETGWYNPITPHRQNESVFYGLAKAAGDSTQSSSSNAVGTYTETAKSAISDMLNAPETVSGTTPSITAKAGIRYICGEVATLTVVVPASGIVDVVFESGSTPTVLTVTPPSGVTAVKWANGFDPTALDANATYELNIMDGEYGVACTWT